MDLNNAPFNISLMDNNRNILKNLTPVTSVDVYDGSSKNFHPEGLFSTEIFGRIAEPRRKDTFSYIDLQCKLIHPILYKNIERVSSNYINIINGTAFATWDSKSKKFIESDAVNGETGYSFFFSKFSELKFDFTDSDLRKLKIDILNKFAVSGTYGFILVIPAGLRDVEEDAKKVLSQDEVNDYYRSLIGLSRNIDPNFKDNKFNDGTKLLMQRNFNAIYELFFSYLEGKRGAIQEKFAKRRLDYGTRTVFATMDLGVENLHGHQAPSLTDCFVGLYQTTKGLLPLTVNSFKHEMITETFLGDNTALLINKKTLVRERVDIPLKTYDEFMTDDGVNDILNKFAHESRRNKPIIINKHYLAMVYNDGVGVKVIQDIDRVPEDKLSMLTPITWGELLYYLFRPYTIGKALWVTRYPIIGEDSMIPNTLYLKTTFKGKALFEYDDDWNLKSEMVYNEWPNRDEKYMDTLAVSPRHLAGLDGDHDGDTGSGDYPMTDDASKEVDGYFDDIENWFEDGELRGCFNTDTIAWALKSMTT